MIFDTLQTRHLTRLNLHMNKVHGSGHIARFELLDFSVACDCCKAECETPTRLYLESGTDLRWWYVCSGECASSLYSTRVDAPTEPTEDETENTQEEDNGRQWTWFEVRTILSNHSIPESDFLADFGTRELYPVRPVLAWLRY